MWKVIVLLFVLASSPALAEIAEVVIEAEKVDVLSNGSLQVRDATVILRDGVRDESFPPKYHRYVVHPGDDLTGKPERVIAIAKTVWTKEVLKKWKEIAAEGERRGSPATKEAK